MSETSMHEGRSDGSNTSDESKVQLSQLELDRLIDRKFGDGYAKAEGKLKGELELMNNKLAELEAERKRLSGELEEQSRGEDYGEMEELRNRVRNLAEADKRSRIITVAARTGALDPELVALALSDKVKADESGELIPVGPDGLCLPGEDGQPTSLESMVAGFLNERPYLVRPAFQGGSGTARAGTSGSVGTIEGLSPEDLKRMSSIERKALLEANRTRSFRW